MMERIKSLPQGQRIALFWSIIIFVVLLFGIAAIFIFQQAVASPERTIAIPIREDVSVREFATLPDGDAYPAALAINDEGVLFTGSYVSGALWRIMPDGTVTEIANARDNVQSVTGLTITPDGDLLVLDRIAPLSAEGAIIWRVNLSDDTLQDVRRFPARGDDSLLLASEGDDIHAIPDDIVTDAQGRIYISDRGPGRVWRFDADGTNGGIWWRKPASVGDGAFAPTGLAYDAANDAILISEPAADAIYSVPVTAESPESATMVLYRYNGSQFDTPGFDGLTIAPDGTIYAAAYGSDRLAMLSPDDNRLIYLSQGFRGGSDVAYDAARNRVYMTNWDPGSLIPSSFLIFFTVQTEPRLPFAIDVIEFNANDDT